MDNLKERFKKIGFIPSDIILPKEGTNLEKWAVVACDQYTSQTEYWESVEDFVGKAPSTLNLIYPECYLDEPDSEKRISRINSYMDKYLNEGLFDTYPNCFFLVKRTFNGKSRLGLIGSLDLENYSWEKDSKTPIRATEGTILSRIPPRKRIREKASLEFPHIMVLISDPSCSVIEPIFNKVSYLKKIYQTNLMKNSGSIEAWQVSQQSDLENICNALEILKSGLKQDNPLLFAMGDGNHSFATAKACWEDIKKDLSDEEKENHPARYCLVELENIFDSGLEFEPINRVLFNVPEEVFINELEKVAQGIEYEPVMCKKCIDKRLKDQTVQGFGYCTTDKHCYVRISKPQYAISAATIQKVIDSLTEKGYKVDYIHGLDVTDELGSKDSNIGVFLPAIEKNTFFNAIISDGALPRKTFSMGSADEKRFYIEGRKIR